MLKTTNSAIEFHRDVGRTLVGVLRVVLFTMTILAHRSAVAQWIQPPERFTPVAPQPLTNWQATNPRFDAPAFDHTHSTLLYVPDNRPFQPGTATAEYWTDIGTNQYLVAPVRFQLSVSDEVEPFDDAPRPPDLFPADEPEDISPNILRLPRETADPEDRAGTPPTDAWLQFEQLPPLGYAGPSSVLPSEYQEDQHFIPMEDRWRIGFPSWDRYGKGHPRLDDYPYDEGNIWNPYKQNVLKGDYPIIGNHTFFNFTGTSLTNLEFRQVPTPTTPFESTPNPGQEEFFGNPDQFFYLQDFFLSFELFHGDAFFKQPDWKIRLTPVFNINYLDVEELAVVNPDVRRGTTRQRGDFSLNEWFVETKLADLGPDYDTLSVRGGSQLFISDFRGFIFSDINRSVRLFGTRLANRDQFNLIVFDQTEKETNSQLNTFDDRNRNTIIANYYRQDFIWPGYTVELSYHFNHDGDSFFFDRNDFLNRPDPAGVFAPHEVNTHYIGCASNGHINRINVSHAFYWAFGHDSLNPIAGQPITIDAKMAAIELSYDRDWVRFRTSYFYSSGDDDATDHLGQGFDAIFDNPNFAGGPFSYWNRQSIRLFGVALVDRLSLIPNLKSSKLHGQTNFVNPGLHLVNVGMDADITPRLKAISNVNFLWFDKTDSLEIFTFQDEIDNWIGVDMSLGFEYRPLHNNNIIIEGGISGLLPGEGFKDLYNPLVGETNALFGSFVDVILQY